MEKTFEEWLKEIEVFSSRAERLYEDFPEVKPSEVAEWRERLAAEFGFGSGKWVAQNLLKESKND